MSDDQQVQTIESGPEWLTVTQAAAALSRNEKTIRRMIERGQLTAQKVTTSTGQEWRIEPSGALDKKRNAPDVPPDTGGRPKDDRRVETLPLGQETDSHPGNQPDNEPDSVGQVPDANGAQIVAVAGEVHALRGEVEQLRAFIAGGAMAALSERLAAMPDADTVRAIMAENRAETAQMVADAVVSAVGQAMAAQREEAAPGATAEDVQRILDELQKVRDDNARLSGEIEQMREQKEQGRGFFARLFNRP